MKEGYISEIYSSIQGEGPYTGEKQIFLRLAGCPLRCDYCDTPYSLTAKGHPKMEAQDAAREVIDLSKESKATTVSITGGEPLVHLDFLLELIPILREAGLKIYLETAGIHPQALRRIIDDCDVVAMDIKLPSATGKEFWKEHEEFLEVGGDKLFTKVVLEAHSKDDEIDQMISLLSKRKKPPTLVLQLVTPMGPSVAAPSVGQVSKVYEKAKIKIPRVLVMTQRHKEWGIP